MSSAHNNEEFSFLGELPSSNPNTPPVTSPTPEQNPPEDNPTLKLPKSIRAFIDGTSELMAGHLAFTKHLGTMPGDAERLALCECVLSNCAFEDRQHTARALRTGIVAAHACLTPWENKDGSPIHKNASHYKRDLFARLRLGTSASQISRNVRAGALFLQLQAVDLPVSGDSAEPLVQMLSRKDKAVAEWRQLVKAAKGKAPSPAQVTEHLRKIRGEQPKSHKVKVAGTVIEEACRDLIDHLPRTTPAEIERHQRLAKLLALARGEKAAPKKVSPAKNTPESSAKAGEKEDE